MFFVFLAHFTTTWFSGGLLQGRLPAALVTVAYIASPTFLLISGLVPGLLWRRNPGSFPRLRRQLIDKGLFLLTVGHVLVALAHIARWNAAEAFRFVYITDVIGLCIIAGPYLLTRVRCRARLCAGLCAIGLSWWMIGLRADGALLPTAVGTLLWGGDGRSGISGLGFPPLPWFGFYLIAQCLGEWIGQQLQEGSVRELLPRLRRMAFGAMSVAASAKLLVLFAKYTLGVEIHPLLRSITLPTGKFPPSPGYLLFYGGAGLLLLYALAECAERGWFARVRGQLTKVGRTALFVFVAQYYVYFNLLILARPEADWAWPIYFAASLVMLYVLSSLWWTWDGNALLSVGYGAKRQPERGQRIRG